VVVPVVEPVETPAARKRRTSTKGSRK
jgi:hypothetical protein